jgi:hypothetical protein
MSIDDVIPNVAKEEGSSSIVRSISTSQGEAQEEEEIHHSLARGGTCSSVVKTAIASRVIGESREITLTTKVDDPSPAVKVEATSRRVDGECELTYTGEECVTTYHIDKCQGEVPNIVDEMPMGG